MASIREIQNRMRSIQDNMKITNAMYMISSTHLRKAKQRLEETESYFFTLQSMMERIIRHMPDVENVYFDERKKKPVNQRVAGILVITADKGLAGAYNHNVLKMALELMEQFENSKLFVVGEVGRHFFASRKIPIDEQFHYTAQNPSLHRARVISETVLEQFKNGELDEVYIIYTGMKNGIVSENAIMEILPLKKQNVLSEEAHKAGFFEQELEFSPSPAAVLENIVPDYVMGYIYGALVESFCSEQNSRMLAMEAANKSAREMLHDLSIEYNRVRQSLITQEITEVIAGVKAQKRKKMAQKAKKARKEGHVR